MGGRMRLLDLFCGAGGSAVGYYRAGFTDIVGVDIVNQPHYPFNMYVADAIDFVASNDLSGFDLIHASPPCQAYSVSTAMWRGTNDYPDLVEPTRLMLQDSGIPYVIENVPGAPLGYSITLCGSTLGLPRIRRHRHFETFWPMMSPGCDHSRLREPLSVSGHSEHGSGYNARKLPHGLAARAEAMGIDWMTRDELSEAIPPAFTKFIGEEFINQLVLGGTE